MVQSIVSIQLIMSDYHPGLAVRLSQGCAGFIARIAQATCEFPVAHLRGDGKRAWLACSGLPAKAVTVGGGPTAFHATWTKVHLAAQVLAASPAWARWTRNQRVWVAVEAFGKMRGIRTEGAPSSLFVLLTDLCSVDRRALWHCLGEEPAGSGEYRDQVPFGAVVLC